MKTYHDEEEARLVRDARVGLMLGLALFLGVYGFAYGLCYILRAYFCTH